MSRRVRVVAICAVLALGAGCQSSPGPAIGASSRANVPLSTAPIAFVLANPSGLLALDASGGVVRQYDLPPDAFPSGPAIAPHGRQRLFALTRIGANGDRGRLPGGALLRREGPLLLPTDAAPRAVGLPGGLLRRRPYRARRRDRGRPSGAPRHPLRAVPRALRWVEDRHDRRDAGRRHARVVTRRDEDRVRARRRPLHADRGHARGAAHRAERRVQLRRPRLAQVMSVPPDSEPASTGSAMRSFARWSQGPATIAGSPRSSAVRSVVNSARALRNAKPAIPKARASSTNPGLPNSVANVRR